MATGEKLNETEVLIDFGELKAHVKTVELRGKQLTSEKRVDR